MQLHSRKLFVVAALAAMVSTAGAQTARRASGETLTADTSIFARLTGLPSPNEYRLASGAPGPAYWQNRADYDIHATLDTAKHELRGELTLHYTNNSPTALDHIWLQVEQNAFTDSSLNAYIYPQNSRFGARGFEGGDRIERFDQLGGAKGKSKGKRTALKTRVWDTMLFAELAEPLGPGKSADFDIAWHFAIPEHGADRMGRDGSLYELAQWYPRVAVYDDVRGWNTDPYVGQGEFYLEYGDFTYDVTVPAGYILAGTGTLTNARDVLTAGEIASLARAAKSDSTTHIVTAAELAAGGGRPRADGTLTWKFQAKNVRDVAWAGAPDYNWDASSWKGIVTNAYYRPSAEATWKDGADMARTSIEGYSTHWYQYPYPQISVVEGPISGMEYPMLAMEARGEDKYDLYNVITHEIGHNWFPMIVGSNERIHFWQDEGINTFINTFSEAERYPERGDQMQRAAEERSLIEQTQVRDLDIPVDMPADRIDPGLLGFTEYVKPSVGLQLLRQEILGPEAFDAAFRAYIRRWAYKHPTPSDFYRTMEDVSGHHLDWFWREWFIEDAHFDQAVDTVVTRRVGDTTYVAVGYGNHDRGVFPIRVRFTFADGSSRDFDYPAEVWSMAGEMYVRRYAFPGAALASIELDPDHRLIDDDRSNDKWTASSVAAPTRR